MGAQSPAGYRMPQAEGCGLGIPLSAQQPLGRWPCSRVPGSSFWSESQLHLFLPAPGGERKHHLSAGADSVGDYSGLPQKFKMEMA